MINTADHAWHWGPELPQSQLPLCNWLQDAGSLTERLRRHCRQFRVQLQSTTAEITLTPTQAAWIGAERAFCREVLLLCDEQPWVYASSLYSPSTLNVVPALAGLGQRALGELLFEDPQLQRREFEFAQLTAAQWRQLAQMQSIVQDTAPGDSYPLPWARRSLLATGQAGVLVTELFLPAAQAYRE
ncbi:chorismate--pyruvate lyase family protein [Oceanisphaera arctica]|uniref:chorismate--pyruvate lyase family protein n=1 Tax=Oceanisphaera arctica TaxID=641510 RepID=UPI0019943518|nr:chorismate lyase [Oceanisphaera arctica]GHA13469.1 putative chorismate pyruvate-lyase [Oceanisphaera arctica]